MVDYWGAGSGEGSLALNIKTDRHSLNRQKDNHCRQRKKVKKSTEKR